MTGKSYEFISRRAYYSTIIVAAPRAHATSLSLRRRISHHGKRVSGSSQPEELAREFRLSFPRLLITFQKIERDLLINLCSPCNSQLFLLKYMKTKLVIVAAPDAENPIRKCLIIENFN